MTKAISVKTTKLFSYGLRRFSPVATVPKVVVLLLIVGFGVLAEAGGIVSGTRFQQRYPWNGLVDIDFTISCGSQAKVDLSVTAKDRTSGAALSTSHLWLLDGTNRLTNLRVGSGSHRLLWDAGQDVPAGFISTNVSVSVRATAAQLRYMVIDLSPTSSTVNPVSYLADMPEGGWTDEYKTTKLVLRRIEPSTFLMGSSGEIGGSTSETRHSVSLTRPYYIGVFEVTQRQWELVMGTRPSWFSNPSYYESRPVECVSYRDIRGSDNWPVYYTVAESSFIGMLRRRTGDESFDLPTEAQWENACRAGTQTALSNGHNLESTSSDCSWLHSIARYRANSAYFYVSSERETIYGTAAVGSYLPNAWGLYDMHGNVAEWCLDYYEKFAAQSAIDPVGPRTGAQRVLRGGSWYRTAQECRSASRYMTQWADSCFDHGNVGYGKVLEGFGFRLCRVAVE